MKLIRRASLRGQENGSEHIYEVDLCEVSSGKFVVNFRYGRQGGPLREGSKTPRSVNETTAQAIFQKLVASKTRLGYQETQVSPKKVQRLGTKALPVSPQAREQKILACLAARGQEGSWSYSRALWRAGELRLKAAVPHMIDALGSTNDAMVNYCLIWALGRCGDASTIQALAQKNQISGGLPVFSDVELIHELISGSEASEQLTRISLESLRNWGCDARRSVVQKALSELPEDLGKLAVQGPAEAFAEVLHSNYESLEAVYRIDNEYVRPALLETIKTMPLRPGAFRVLRHLFKMAEFRQDAQVFGLIAYRLERVPAMFSSSSYYVLVDGRYCRDKEELKKPDAKVAYSSATRFYLRKRVWRTLARFASLGDAESYVNLAVGVLLPFSDSDGGRPTTTYRYDYQARKTKTTHWDRFSQYHAFNYILYTNSPRYEKQSKNWSCKEGYSPGDPSPQLREEAFPELWDQVPVGLLHLLVESRCLRVHEFAVQALRANDSFCHNLELEIVALLLSRPYEVTARFAFEMAKGRYDAQAPYIPLLAAMATCVLAEARREVRKFLLASNFSPEIAQSVAHEFLLRLSRMGQDSLIEPSVSAAIVQDLCDTLRQVFVRELRSLDLQLISQLLAHPWQAVQQFIGQILLEHELKPEELPTELLAQIMNSSFAEVRAMGMRLFSLLPDPVLLERHTLLASFVGSPLADVREAVRPVLRRLIALDRSFAAGLSSRLIPELWQKEPYEGLHNDLLTLFKTDLRSSLTVVDKSMLMRLLHSKSTAAQELGGILLADHIDRYDFTIVEMAKFASHDVLAVRQAAWKFYRENLPRLKQDMAAATRILDAKWDDSREFAFHLFHKHFSEDDFTPAVIVAVCDSVRADVQKFGRDLITRFFRQQDGQEYLLKLSEHPTADLQLFATNYLEEYAAGNIPRLRQLEPYFLSVLSQVYRGRVAKTRVLAFLLEEAKKSREAAALVAKILTRQSLTFARGDKANILLAMMDIHQHFPEIAWPMTVATPSLRSHPSQQAQVQHGV